MGLEGFSLKEAVPNAPCAGAYRGMVGRPPKRLVNPPNRIREVRGEMTQAALGLACGVSNETVRKWETGENELTLARLERVAKALKVRPGALLNDYEPGRDEDERELLAAFRSLGRAGRQLALAQLRLLMQHERRSA